MNHNPISIKTITKKILDDRVDATGTIRDGFKHEKTGISMKELWYKVAVAEDKISCSRATEEFNMSKDFASKWSHIYKAKKLLNSKYKNCKVPMSIFDSISTHPKRIIRKFWQKARKRSSSCATRRSTRNSALRT